MKSFDCEAFEEVDEELLFEVKDRCDGMDNCDKVKAAAEMKMRCKESPDDCMKEDDYSDARSLDEVRADEERCNGDDKRTTECKAWRTKGEGEEAWERAMMKAELSEDDIKKYEKDCKKKKNAKGAECMAYAKRTAKDACKDDDMAEGCSGDDEKKVKEAMKKYCMDNMEDEKCQARGEKVMHCCDKSDMCEMCGDGEKYMWGDCMPISCDSPLACADEEINVHCQDLEEEMDGMMF